MSRGHLPAYSMVAFCIFLMVFVSGCARVNIQDSLVKTNQAASEFTEGHLSLAQTDEQRAAMAKTAAELLAHPLSQKDAVHLVLVNSSAMQAILAQNWSDTANAAQTGRISPWS